MRYLSVPRIQGILFGLATFLSLPMVSAHARVIGSSTLRPDGLVLYEYRVDNTQGAFAISGWSLDFNFATPDWDPMDTASGGEVTVPGVSWLATAGLPWRGLSAQDFLSLDPRADVVVGTEWGVFSFVSRLQPGRISYSEFSADGQSHEGTTIGPRGDSQPLPDLLSTGLGLVAAGGVVGLLRRAVDRQGNRGHAVGAACGVGDLGAAPAMALRPQGGRFLRGILLAWMTGVGFVHALPPGGVTSADMQPSNPRIGEEFTVRVEAPGAVAGTATLDFRPWSLSVVRAVLRPENGLWVARASVPPDLIVPSGSVATLRVLMLDAQHRHLQHTASVAVLGAGNTIRAFFRPDTGVLTVLGTDQGESIVIGRGMSAEVLVNDGSVPILGGVPMVNTTARIRVFGFGGDDSLNLLTVGASIPGELWGGEGDDTLLGGPGNDEVRGGPGNDQFTGRQGVDRLLGGPGEDVFFWNPGDASDSIEGGGDADTLVFQGANIGEVFEFTAEGSQFRLTRSIASISLPIGGVERVTMTTKGGSDSIRVGDLSGTPLRSILLDLSGSSTPGVGDGQADEILVHGSNGNDTMLFAEQGDLRVLQGLTATVSVRAFEPTLDRWTVFGDAGSDRFVFQGTDAGEALEVFADGAAAVFFAPGVGPWVHLVEAEEAVLHPLRGTDQIGVGDLSGTALERLSLDLSAAPGGAGPDGDEDAEADLVTLRGSAQDDVLHLHDAGSAVMVDGFAPQIRLTGLDADKDRLVVQGGLGRDTLDASTLQAGRVQLTLDGGLDVDRLVGSQGSDLLMGGRGEDRIEGGDGDDTLAWYPGDGSDVLEGQEGADLFLMNGSAVSEIVDLGANGSRARLTRNIASITIDMDGVETVAFRALGGSDIIHVGSLIGTEVTQAIVDLAGAVGGNDPDTQPDTVIVDGTEGRDEVLITSGAEGVFVDGLAAKVSILRALAGQDLLLVRTFGGDDVINASALAAAAIGFEADGGEADDFVLGGEGPDVLRGGPGDDVLIGGPGIDVLDGGTGLDALVQ